MKEIFEDNLEMIIMIGVIILAALIFCAGLAFILTVASNYICEC